MSSNDLLEYWEEDDATDLILLYLESFGNPRKFARVAGRVARSKPILAMRSGTSRAGARAASSHTAALASSDAAVDALFWQAGVLRLRTLEELLDAAVLFSTQPLPRGDRVAVLTNAGGLGILCADACEVAGLKLPPLADETVRALQKVIPAEASVSNPVDILGSATAATYEATLPLLINDPGIDAVICLFVPPVVARAADVAGAIAHAAGSSDKPVLPVVMSADGTRGRVRLSGVGCARTRTRGTSRRLVAPPRGRATEARPRRPSRCKRADRGRASSRAATSGSSLQTSGRCSAHTVCRSSTNATRHRRPLRSMRRPRSAIPVVVKTAVAGAHKTEIGRRRSSTCVTPRASRAACAAISGPVLVQSFLTAGVELLVGAIRTRCSGR